MIKKYAAFLLAGLCSTAVMADLKTVEKSLAQNYPDLRISTIQTTEVPQLYSANIEGEIFYLTEDAKHVIAGPLIRLKDGKNLTQVLKMQNNAIDWKKLPLKDAIKVVKGTGKHQLAVFSDPNCPYCQQLEKELAQLDNVTIYTFVLAFKPQSVALSKQFFCEADVALAWQNYMQKSISPKGNKRCDNPVQRNLDLAKQLKVEGTPSLVFANGYQVLGGMSAEGIRKTWQDLGL